ncbi:MAG TPA: hypothetical protein VLI06_06540, partial [Solimonas sp.]|nr:hypothetical protein [Solimonas sp.]
MNRVLFGAEGVSGRAMPRILVALAVLLLALLAAFALLPGLVDDRMNRRLQPPPYQASPQAQALHARLSVADLHADSLLWGRDLLQRSE